MPVIDKTIFKSILDNLDDGIFLIDREQLITYWNKTAEELTGYKKSEVHGMPCDTILKSIDEQGNEFCQKDCSLDDLFAVGKRRSEELYILHKEGHRIPVSMRILPVKTPEGDVFGAGEIITDISEKIAFLQKIEELEKLALLDPLTGLANRRFIENQIGVNINEKERYGWSFGLLFIDIDWFKKVNDSYGHTIGDEVIKMVGRTLLHSLRSSDIVGRWGGEEFVAVVVNVTDEQLKSVAEKFLVLVRQSSLHTDSDDISVTISIGATKSRENDTIKTIMKRADKFLYTSKQTGRNRITID